MQLAKRQSAFLTVAMALVMGFVLAATLGQIQPRLQVPTTAQLIISPPADSFYLEEIDSAKTEIDAMLYQFSFEPLKQALGKAAARGVKVRVILERRVDSNLKTAEELSSLGVKVKWATTEFANTHAKTAAIDGEKLFVGSTNWSQHAMRQNREVSVLMESKDLTQEFLKVFEEDWKKASDYRQ